MSSLLVMSKANSLVIDGADLCVIGGSQSSGRRIDTLKETGDYAVASVEKNGAWRVHRLIGKKRGVETLTPLVPITIEDLTLISLPNVQIKNSIASQTSSTGSSHRDHDWTQATVEIMRSFSEPSDLTPALDKALEAFKNKFGFERGLIILQVSPGEYSPVVSHGLKMTDPWLSESLIQDTLNASAPIAVSNVIGSPYDQSKSLIATGFMSVLSYPLIVRGKVLGAIVAGSTKPHSGLNEQEKTEAQILVSLAALLVQFHQRDEAQKTQIEASRAAREMQDGPFATQTQKMREAMTLAQDVADSNLSVLLEGETGTGKELFARWIHDLSPRRRGPFVAINCSAIPKDLLETVLFGHKRGAFTGATTDQIGKFQLANGGTLFLDEIADLPLGLQAKILRAVQERVVEPIGSNHSQRIDVRFIAATHKSVAALVKAGEFRDDLYYRLAEVRIGIPALRDRREDIPLLAAQFLKDFAPEKTLANATWTWLKSRDWPGNVRELRSTLRRVALLTQDAEVGVADFTRGMPISPSDSSRSRATDDWLGGQSLDEARDRFTAEKVREALERSQGHRARAAELLGITPRTLFRYLDEYSALLRDVTDLSHRTDASVARSRGPDA